jgi:hypothetical protein
MASTIRIMIATYAVRCAPAGALRRFLIVKLLSRQKKSMPPVGRLFVATRR